MWLEMNCAAVWEDVDIRVMPSSKKHSPVLRHCVAERNNLRKMLHWCYIKTTKIMNYQLFWRQCEGRLAIVGKTNNSHKYCAFSEPPKVEKWKIAICTRVILCYLIISTCQENYPASFPFYYWLKYLVVLIMHSILCELFVFPTIASLPSHCLQKMHILPHRFLPAAVTK
jgi:hypothetical protein